MRVRWRSAGKAAAALALALAALQVLAGVLKPPQAPPLAADVGLPRVGTAERELVIREAAPEPRRRARARRAPAVSAARAMIGTTPRRRRPTRRRVDLLSHTERNSTDRVRPTPATAPEPTPYAPPPEVPEATAPAPAPAPEPPPQPGDGSVEFAPH